MTKCFVESFFSGMLNGKSYNLYYDNISEENVSFLLICYIYGLQLIPVFISFQICYKYKYVTSHDHLFNLLISHLILVFSFSFGYYAVAFFWFAGYVMVP
jgi:hypothetical protein